MRVEPIARPGPEWDEFAESTPGVCVGHAAAWAHVLHDAYGLEPCYLAARDGAGSLSGILPLVRFRTLLGRTELISLPYLDAAGILARSDEAERALHDAALELTRDRRAAALELRQPRPLRAATATARGASELADDSETTASDRIDLILTLETDAETQWKALRAKVRNQTRKAQREGLTLAEAPPDELLPEFYGPFERNMRDLGSPVHALRFFRAAALHFGDRLRIVVTRLGQRPVGGLVAIHYGPTVTVPWASTLRSERHRCPNNLIYWEALRWAVESGAREFDFGRSPPGSGTHRFKRGWGAREEPLAWLRQTPSGAVIPGGIGNRNVVLTRLSAIWTRLPIPVAGFLGTRVRRYFAN